MSKESHRQMMNKVARSSQERHRTKRMILGEGRRNTGMDRDGWRDSFAKVKPQE
jgi:hypothetical protein